MPQNKGQGGDTSKRGFASMDEEKQREIASKGGKAAHEQGVANEFTPEQAAEAGRRAHEMGRAHEFSSEEAAEAGKKGGQSRQNRGQGGQEQTGDEEE